MTAAAPLCPRDHQQIPPRAALTSSLAVTAVRFVQKLRVFPPSMVRDQLISRPVPQVGASVTEVERGREPGEVLRDFQRVLLIVHVEQFDGRFVIVVIVQVGARRARSLVVGVEFLVHAVGQRATLVYKLQLSTRFLQPDLFQRYICISPIDDGLLGANSRQPDHPFELPVLQDLGD